MNAADAIAAIEARDAAIGAVWHLDRAARGDWPVLVKDNIAVAGMPWTAGLAAHARRVAEADAPCIEALRRAGAAILGKLAMHEGALGATTDTPRACFNPLRAGFTPGGSSGGSGAAVAAGYVRSAIGTDTMGSVRIPAAYCGVVGLKPTAGLVGRSGVTPLSPTLDTVGVVAATPREALATLAALVAPDEADPGWLPAPPGWDAAYDPARARLARALPAWQAAMEEAVRDAAEHALRGLAHTDAAMPLWRPGAARRAGLLLAEAEAAVAHAALLNDPHAASAAFRDALAHGRDAGTSRLVRALEAIARARAAAWRALASADALILPTAPQRAFPQGAPPPPDQADFTALANLAGLPAIAFPVAARDGGLPASLQLVGPPWSEGRLVAMAEWLMAR
jgi:aspartyl-tRNA(Asn)/glutamyl-tRNA(Gln) amidotransferase subunit A